MERRVSRQLTCLVLCLSGLMFAWMLRPLWMGEVPTNGDLLLFHYPLRDFYAQALAQGQSTAWSPMLFGGYYVGGEGQLGAWHPWHWLLYRFLPLDTAFALEMATPYPLMFAGMWIFLRRWCGTAPAALGAMLFTFCGFNLAHGVHINMVSVVAHTPWLLWCIDRLFAGPALAVRLRATAGIGLLTGSQLLLGHPQSVWFSGLMEVAFAAFLIAAGRRPAIGPATLAVTGKLLGVAMGAIQLLATLDMAATSRRQAYDPSFAFSFSLPPGHLLQLIEPYLPWGRIAGWTDVAGDEYAAYGGAVPTLLAIWWFAQYQRSRRGAATDAVDRLGVFAAVLGGVGLVLALGQYGGLYYIQTWLPLVRQFRCPARYVLFTQFALALLSALALERLLRRLQHREVGSPWEMAGPWCVAAASVLVAALLGGGPTIQGALTPAGIASVLAGPVLFLAAARLLTLSTRRGGWALGALVLLAAADQALYGLVGVTAWRQSQPREEILESVRENGPPPTTARVVSGHLSNTYTLLGHRLLDGYAAFMPVRNLNYLTTPALRVAQVEYVPEEFLQIATLDEAVEVGRGWYRVPSPIPRARLVTQAMVSSQPDIDLDLMDIDRAALTTRELPLPGGAPGTATILQEQPGEIDIQTRSESRQLLVVSENFHTGWEAQIDDAPARVERVNGDFMGCVVEPGEHRISLRFRPPHLALGKSMGFCGLAGALVAWLASLLPVVARVGGTQSRP